jgi:hypothetical protein
MPCSMSPEEILYAERSYNERKFGRSVSTELLLKEVACDATSVLLKHGLLGEVHPVTRKWLEHHQEEDRRKQREESDRVAEREAAERRELARLKAKYG